MNSLNKELSFMTLYFKHARYTILLVLLFLCAQQLLPFYLELRDFPHSEPGYDYSQKIIQNTSEYPVKEYASAPTFKGLLDTCEYFKSACFGFCIALLCILLISWTMKQGAKTTFTLKRLPISRKRAYFLQVLCSFLALFSVVILQNLIIVISYVIYLHMVPDTLHIYNELFLSYISYDVLIYLCPVFHLGTLLHFILFLVYSAVLSTNGAFYIRHKEYGTAILKGFLLLIGGFEYTCCDNWDIKSTLLVFIMGILIVISEIRNRSKFDYNYVPIHTKWGKFGKRAKKGAFTL